MGLFVHPMSSFVLGHIELFGIPIDTKWELRQIVIIEPVTADTSLASLLIYMSRKLLQTIMEHL